MNHPYTITIINNSAANDEFCIFQQVPDNQASGMTMPLAWFARRIYAGSRVTFQWQNDYDFTTNKMT